MPMSEEPYRLYVNASITSDLSGSSLHISDSIMIGPLNHEKAARMLMLVHEFLKDLKGKLEDAE